MNSESIDRINMWVEQLREGNPKAREMLFEVSADRLMRMTRKMLKGFRKVRRWEETGDVFAEVYLNLRNALERVVPNDARHFLNLAGQHINWALQNLKKHYEGPHGIGRNHKTKDKDGEGNYVEQGDLVAASSTCDPEELEKWTEFHRQAEQLPDGEKEVFNLLFYCKLDQKSAAKLMGISVDRLQKKWYSAQWILKNAMGDEFFK